MGEKGEFGLKWGEALCLASGFFSDEGEKRRKANGGLFKLIFEGEIYRTILLDLTKTFNKLKVDFELQGKKRKNEL